MATTRLAAVSLPRYGVVGRRDYHDIGVRHGDAVWIRQATWQTSRQISANLAWGM
jgi:hypothetical protein